VPVDAYCDKRLAFRNMTITYLMAAPSFVGMKLLMNSDFQAGLDYLDPGWPGWDDNDQMHLLIYRGLRYQIDQAILESEIKGATTDWITQLGHVVLEQMEGAQIAETAVMNTLCPRVEALRR
jgi:hypothetical protein